MTKFFLKSLNKGISCVSLIVRVSRISPIIAFRATKENLLFVIYTEIGAIWLGVYAEIPLLVAEQLEVNTVPSSVDLLLLDKLEKFFSRECYLGIRVSPKIRNEKRKQLLNFLYPIAGLLVAVWIAFW